MKDIFVWFNLLGLIATWLGLWLQHRRRRPILEVSVQKADNRRDWFFELVIENREGTDLEVQEVEFLLDNKEVIKVSKMGGFYDADERPIELPRIRGWGIARIKFDMALFGTKLNSSICAVHMFDHLHRRLELRRRRCHQLQVFILEYMK